MKRFLLLLLGIIFVCGLFVTTHAEDDENYIGYYTCKYYMKGKDNDCIIKVDKNKQKISQNCPFLTQEKIKIITSNPQKCSYTKIYSSIPKHYTCLYKKGKCSITVTGKEYDIKCTPNISAEMAMESFRDNECTLDDTP